MYSKEDVHRNDAFYPGTFDPITLGHLDVIEEAARIFGNVTVGVLENPAKSPMFTTEQRVEMIRKVLESKGLYNVQICVSDKATVEVARKVRTKTIVRGVRLNTDFEQELFLCLNNRALDPGTTTIFIPPKQERIHVSSTAVREILRLGMDSRLDKYLHISTKNQIAKWRKQ